MTNSITTNFITSFHSMKKSTFENACKDKNLKTVNIIKILANFENKPRFSIDMVQKEYLKISNHFNNEKNIKKECNSTDITFIKEVFKSCFLLAFENGIYFDFALQNGVITFLKVKENPFRFTKEPKEPKEPKSENSKLLECLENCEKSIDFSKVDNETLLKVIATLKSKIKK